MRTSRALKVGLILTIALTLNCVPAAQGSQEPSPSVLDGTEPPGVPNLVIPRHPKLDSRMAALAEAAEKTLQDVAALAAAQGNRISRAGVQVQIVIREGARERTTQVINALGGTVTGTDIKNTILQGWIPPGALKALGSLDDVLAIRHPDEAILFEELAVGAATTEALDDMNIPLWHSAGYTGRGTTIAIIDGGFVGYTGLLGMDLPDTVTVRNFVDGQEGDDVNSGSSHGTACAEVIHDIAPDADLVLAKISTNIDLGEAVMWLIANTDVDIISTSLGWYTTTPGDGTGEFADMVDAATDAGILWVTAAGNDRLSHWGGTFNDSSGSGFHNFSAINEINYIDKALAANKVFAVYVRWDDWTSVTQDYDLTLWRYDGGTSQWQKITESNNTQNGGLGQRPTEFAYALTSGNATLYGFSISRYNASRNVHFEVFTPKQYPLFYDIPERSLANLADSPNALTVAALNAEAPYTLEYYSAEGPTNGPGGTASGGAMKPDIAGFANVSTVTYGTQVFNGTSSATPHIAGAAAVLLSANPGYSQADLRSAIQAATVDHGAPGVDTQFGHGRLRLGTPPEPQGPSMISLPSYMLEAGAPVPSALDLRTYAFDPVYDVSQLTFAITNTPAPEAGISLSGDGNRYLNIAPTPGWLGKTTVVIEVTNPAMRTDSGSLLVVVTDTVSRVYLPVALMTW